MEGLGW